MPEHLLALDAGTTSIRALVVGLDGTIHARIREPLAITYPAPGRVEQNPEHIWQTALDVLQRALREAKLNATDIIALGITTQRASCMIWECAMGRPLTPLVSWQDLRGARRSAELRDAGFFVLPQSAAAKLESVLDSIPNGRTRATAGELSWGNIDSYLVHRLSGGEIHATDVSQACTTAYLDHTGNWDARLIEHQGVPANLFPNLVDTCGHFGETIPGLFGAAVPITAIVGDQQSAAIAQGACAPGDGKVTYGTSATANVHTGAKLTVIEGTYPLFLAQRKGVAEFCVEGMVITAGAALDWLAAILGRSVADLDALASSVSDSGGVSFLPALQGVGSPHGDTARRGLLTGLSRATEPGHIARAAFEGIAFRVREVLHVIYAHRSLPQPKILKIDGGASASSALMQLQSDVLGMPVERMLPLEASAYGAALLAGEGIGRPIRRTKPDATIAEPRLSKDERESRFAAWRAACNLT